MNHLQSIRYPLTLILLGTTVFISSACGKSSTHASADEDGSQYPNIKEVSYVINASEEQAVTYSYRYTEDGLLSEFLVATIDKTGEGLEGSYEEENSYSYYYDYQMDEHGYPELITMTDSEGKISTVKISNKYKHDTLESAELYQGETDAGELLLNDVFLRAEIYSNCILRTDEGAVYEFGNSYLCYQKTTNGDESTFNSRHDELTSSFGTYVYDENGLAVKYTPASSDGSEKTPTELTYTTSFDEDRQCDVYSVDFAGGWSRYYVSSDHMVIYVENYSTENDCYISVSEYEYH